MPTEERYFADIAPEVQEEARLKQLEAYMDPMAKEALLAAGLGPGSRVLEIGPGAGSMVRWMVDQVGPTGHVTGIDINPRFLADLDLPNATILEGDILDPPADLGPFDIVYARYVVLHLPEPVAGLRTMLTLLVPGGRAVTIDPDFRTLASVDPDHPKAADMAALRDTTIEVLRSAGIMNLVYGPMAVADYIRAGFTDVRAHGQTRMMRCDTDELAHFPASIDPAQGAIEAYAPEAQINFDAMRAAFEDPDMQMTSSLEVITVGTRPG